MKFLFTCFRIVDGIFLQCIALLLFVLLLALGGLVLVQVISRDLFNSGIVGVETVSRHTVLWLAFLGAMLGTRNRQHISIDVLTRALSHRPRNVLRILIDGLSCFVTFMLARAAYTFVIDESFMGEQFFGAFPLWWIQTIIPFGFGMISLEYAIGVLLDIFRLWKVGDHHYAGDWRKYISS